LAIERWARDAGRDAFQVQFGGEDAASGDEWGQCSDDVFYFGKFRHTGLKEYFSRKGAKPGGLQERFFASFFASSFAPLRLCVSNLLIAVER
jgi:hypothetical protein